MGHGTLQTVLAVKVLVMDSPMPHSFLHQIMCDTFNNANDLTGKIACDVPVNGNIFLGATVWDVHTNRNI